MVRGVGSFLFDDAASLSLSQPKSHVQFEGSCHPDSSVEYNSNSNILKSAKNLLTEQCKGHKQAVLSH